MTQAISTPCLKVCVVDGMTDICLGCGRTLPEIASWGRKSEPERLAIMAALPDRMKSKDIVPPATIKG